MKAEGRLVIDFFFQDPVSENVTSVSVGDVWLYFWKETFVGVRNMKTSTVYILWVRDDERRQDGYSHRHQIDQDEINDAFAKEIYQDGIVRHLTAPELTSTAINLVANAIVGHVDHAMNTSTKR